jgi:hypothetical protein
VVTVDLLGANDFSPSLITFSGLTMEILMVLILTSLSPSLMKAS